MKKRVFSLALAFALALALVPAFTAPAQAAGTWQDAYANQLSGKSTGFYLYDIDKDSMPELILENGRIYTYKNNSLKDITDWGVDDCTFEFGTLKGKDGILVVLGTIRSTTYMHYTMANGALNRVSASEVMPSDDSTIYFEFRANTSTNIKTYITDTASSTPANQHYFAAELEKFNEDNAGTYMAAYLRNLDSDDVNEVIAIAGSDSISYGLMADFNGKIAVFDIENSKGTTADIDIKVSGFGSYRIYVSSKKYIIVEEPDEWSDTYTAYQYKSGSITKVESFGGSDGGGGYSGLTENDYRNKANKYGIDDIATLIISGYIPSYSGSATQAPAKDQTAEILAMTAAPSGKTGTPTASTVYVNSVKTDFEAYTIGGNNYFKLRDLAKVLSGSVKQFEVGYNNSTKAITLTSGKAYTSVGGEMAAGDGKAKTAAPTASKIYLDGRELSLTVYTINGNNFFKLRDLMKAIDVYVGYDTATKNITLDTSKGYVEP